MNFQPDILAQIIQAILHEDRNTQVLLGKWNKSFIYIYHTSYREQQSILGTNNKKEYRQVPSDSGWNVFFFPFLRAGRGWDDRCRAKWCIARDQPRQTWFLLVEENGDSFPRWSEACGGWPRWTVRCSTLRREWCHEWWGDACKGWRELFSYNLKAECDGQDIHLSSLHHIWLKNGKIFGSI